MDRLHFIRSAFLQEISDAITDKAPLFIVLGAKAASFSAVYFAQSTKNGFGVARMI